MVNALAACTVLSCTNELTNLLGYTHVIGPCREETCLWIFNQVGLKPACLKDNRNCVCSRFGFRSAHAYCVAFFYVLASIHLYFGVYIVICMCHKILGIMKKMLILYRCSGQACSTGLDARWNLYRRDVTLYGLLLEVYFNGDVNVQPGLQSCTKLH